MGLASPSETGSPDPRHLHNQQFQPSRADSSGGKGGCACWGASCSGRMLARGPPGPPKGCGLTRAIVRSSPPCGLPHPCASALTQAWPSAGRPASTAPAEGPAQRRAACRAQMPALPSRSQTASPEGGTLRPEEAQPRHHPAPHSGLERCPRFLETGKEGKWREPPLPPGRGPSREQGPGGRVKPRTEGGGAGNSRE